MKLKILVLGSTGLIGHQVFNNFDNNKHLTLRASLTGPEFKANS